MFRIFNESRNEALASGRTGRYFRYVFGEVLLIVIGILIALQIDNWNNEREEEETLDSYLASIACCTLINYCQRVDFSVHQKSRRSITF